MENAIREVCPESAHRWCKWHILRKTKDSLGCKLYSKRSSFKEKFHAVLNHTTTFEEFESAWSALIDEYSLQENTFLQKIFDDRKHWASPYFRELFFAKMSTTQQSESMNHVLKTYVSATSTMHNFVLQYDKFINDRIAAEDKAEFETNRVRYYPMP